MANRRLLLAATVAVVMVTSAYAKGIFQAQGFLSEVRVEGQVLTFRYAGSVSFAYATAPAGRPQARMKPIKLEEVDVPVEIHNWSEPYRPDQRAVAPNVAGVQQALANLAEAKRKIGMSIDNPVLAFSNTGQLTRISGSYVYVWESNQ
jgi:hypothetical protein